MSAGPFQQHGAAERAARRADVWLDAAISDLFLPDDARLDERTRLASAATLRATVAGIEADLRRDAARLLSDRGAVRKAEGLLASDVDVAARLDAAGLLRDRELMEELIGGVRADLLAQGLPVAVDQPDRPSLLVRLGEVPDGAVATAARGLLAAESRRATAGDPAAEAGRELPAELYHRVVWWVAAAIREGATPDADTDRAIAEAAQRSLAVHDEHDRAEAVAARLAAAIDPLPEEVPALLLEALGDRRLLLFLAVLARALDTDVETARGLVVEPGDERLWTALRAVGLGREAIARIAFSLADADPRRDIEALADQLDEIAAIDPDAARVALAPLSLPRSFRAAIRALGRTAAT